MSPILLGTVLVDFVQGVCENPSLWFFEQQLEASKTKTFAGKTQGKSTGKSRKKTFFDQMSVLQNRQLAYDFDF